MLVGEELLFIFHSSINPGNASLSLNCQSGIFLSRFFSSVSSLKQIGLGSSAFSPKGLEQYLLFFPKGILFIIYDGILSLKHKKQGGDFNVQKRPANFNGCM